MCPYYPRQRRSHSDTLHLKRPVQPAPPQSAFPCPQGNTGPCPHSLLHHLGIPRPQTTKKLSLLKVWAPCHVVTPSVPGQMATLFGCISNTFHFTGNPLPVSSSVSVALSQHLVSRVGKGAKDWPHVWPATCRSLLGTLPRCSGKQGEDHC